jgi:hypothetical protein
MENDTQWVSLTLFSAYSPTKNIVNLTKMSATTTESSSPPGFRHLFTDGFGPGESRTSSPPVACFSDDRLSLLVLVTGRQWLGFAEITKINQKIAKKCFNPGKAPLACHTVTHHKSHDFFVQKSAHYAVLRFEPKTCALTHSCSYHSAPKSLVSIWYSFL